MAAVAIFAACFDVSVCLCTSTASGRKNGEMWRLKVRNTVARLARAH